MPQQPLDIVRRWLAGVNDGDTGTVLAHSAPEIRLIGPRGTAIGHTVLSGWMSHSRATFDTAATYARGSAVVVAQRGTWENPEGAPSEADVATRFLVFGGQVMELERHSSLPEALAAAGLTDDDVTS